MHPHLSTRAKPPVPPISGSLQAGSEGTHFQASNPAKVSAFYKNRGLASMASTAPASLPQASTKHEPVKQNTPTPEQHELILSMLPLVKTVVGRIAITLPAHVSQEDLISAGLMGLMDAVQRFDASKGCSLKNYVAIRIRGAVLDELRRMDWAPRSVHRQARDFRKVQEALEQRLGREATEAEIATELKISPEELDRLLEAIRPASFISLQDARSHRDESDDLLHEECIADPKSVNPLENTLNNEQQEMMVQAIQALSPVEQKVLALYYHEGLRLKEIALALNVTESRVSQIHTLAVQRLRTKIEQAQNR
jgi:RNA polymerase sigma factor FliA